jgi:hypothetical protein
MIIYRFRLTSEDQEDFLREIDIQPSQTFLDFHEIIQSSLDLDPCEKAFFYTTDKKYIKHQEISYTPHKKRLRKYDDELDEIITEEFELNLMKDSRLKNFIEDPHQKMIYENWGKEFYAFHIELFKILKLEGGINLPRCFKRIGELQKKPIIPAELIEEPEPINIPVISFEIPHEKDAVLSALEENEAELAEIESHLDDLLIEKEPEKTKVVEAPSEEIGDFVMEEDDIIESVGDFEDLENIEQSQQDFDGESDDY